MDFKSVEIKISFIICVNLEITRHPNNSMTRKNKQTKKQGRGWGVGGGLGREERTQKIHLHEASKFGVNAIYVKS